MEIFDDEYGLPGVITQVEKDYSYGFDSSQWGKTDSLVVIGTAFTGPVGQPVAIMSPEHAKYIFGDSYDSATRREASLVAGIQDAWDRGCRTVYGCRLGGKEMHKDFDLRVESNLRLRLRSATPTNEAKGCYVLYNGKAGEESITFYKPASMATLAEKTRGLVTDKGAVLATTLRLNQDYSLNAHDRLTELINVFNNHSYNNAMVLSIVDENGNDVTNSKNAAAISIGALHSGAYFMGRSHTNVAAEIVTDNQFMIAHDDIMPYVGFDGNYFRTLIKNTDVSQALPIYTQSKKEMQNALGGAGLTLSAQWDFLKSAEAVDTVFVRSTEDFEEVDLSKFEIYKRLGCGFATTAYAIKRTNSKGETIRPRVKESLPTDKKHVIPLEDGIYNTLQDAEIKYRALVCVNADDTIEGKLPRAKDFMIVAPNDVNALGKTVHISTKVDKNDVRNGVKYAIRFEDLESDDAPAFFESMDELDLSQVYKVVGQLGTDKDGNPATLKAANYKNGDIVMSADGKAVYSIVNGKAVQLTGAGLVGRKYIVVHADGTKNLMEYTDGAFKATAAPKQYVLGDVLDHIFIYQSVNGSLTNMGDLKTLLDGEQEVLLVAAEDIATGVTNEIVVRSNEFDTMTLAEMVDSLKEHPIFSKLFDIEITQDGATEKDDFIKDAGMATVAGSHLNETTEVFYDRQVGYDYTARIPYRTTDNFVRQLAQHCVYTELKTTPTFGFIGASHMSNAGLTAVNDRANELSAADFSLYAKNNYGQNLLDSKAEPYPVGKNVSLTCFQYPVVMNRGSYLFSSNGAAGYAGMVSTLPLDQSSTGQPIELSEVDYQFTNSQLKKLTNAGIVTIKRSFTKGLVITDGITMAPADSIFRRLSAARVVGSIEDLIREACEPFIGKENSPANRDALHTSIKSKLDAVKGKIINDYAFNLKSDLALQKLSRIDIDYEIIPIYEIKEIRNTLKVTDELTMTSSSTGTV